MRSHTDVRTEVLADELRCYLGLSGASYPGGLPLARAVQRFGISIEFRERLPFDGINTWPQLGHPTIILRLGLSTNRAETTLCHELREVLENAFSRYVDGYEGLVTSDNDHMNPESDQFVGCFLLPPDLMRQDLETAGYDFARFASAKDRSLPLVLLRLRSLYSTSEGTSRPFAGVWLFEAPWAKVERQAVEADDLRVVYWAHLSGFSAQRRGRAAARQAWLTFPRPTMTAREYDVAGEAISSGQPLVRKQNGFDLFPERQFTVAAEPFFARGVPWRVLVVAVRGDSLPMVEPLIRRLSKAQAARSALVARN